MAVFLEKFIMKIDEKLLIIKILQKGLLDIKAIMAELGPKYAERTVRRWLVDLVNNGDLIKVGKKRGTKYKLSEKQSSIAENLNFSKRSQEIIKQIKQPLYERQLKTYNEEWLDSYVPNKTFYLPETIRIQLTQAGTRFSEVEPAGTYAHQIFTHLLIDLSYNSSRLEGNTYSLLETQRLILKGESVAGKLDEEKIMILNHKEAIRYLVETASQTETNTQTINTLHFLLADGLIETEHAGKLRDHSVKISGSAYIPLEGPDKIMSQLKKIIEKSVQINNAYEQSIFLLIHISYLQAFTDVNKRTARLSANIPLIKNNLVPLSFNDVDKDDYISALFAIYELQNVEPLVELYVYSYLRTCSSYDSAIKTLNYDAIRVRYRQERRALLREIIEKKIIGATLDNFIKTEATKIPETDRTNFIKNVYEDLNLMDESRIVGLGISIAQLKKWLTLFNKNAHKI